MSKSKPVPVNFDAIDLNESMHEAESGDEIIDALERSALINLRHLLDLGEDTPIAEALETARIRRQELFELVDAGVATDEMKLESTKLNSVVVQAYSVQLCRESIKANDIQSAVRYAAQAAHFGIGERFLVEQQRISKLLDRQDTARAGRAVASERSRKKWAQWKDEYEARVANGESSQLAIRKIADRYSVKPDTVKRAIKKV